MNNKPKLIRAVFIILITIIVYIPAINSSYVWDDDKYIINNKTLESMKGLGEIWLEPGATPQYYPTVFTTFWIEYRVWQLKPMGYHINNILLHIANALLLWLILCRLKIPGAYLAAAIFAVHPVHVESVAWITERKNVLSGLFYLLSVIYYFKYLDGRRKKVFYAFSLFLFFLALLSKTVTATLPAVLFLLIWWRKSKISKKDIVPLVPFFTLGIFMGMVTVFMEKYHVGAKGNDWNFSFVERILIAGRAIWFYALKLVLPVNLTFIYPRWNIDTTIWWQYLFPSLVLLLIAVLLATVSEKPGRAGKGPLTALLFFAGTLFPALGFFNVYPFLYSFVADHFQYLASIGPVVLFSSYIYGFSQVAGKWKNAFQKAGLISITAVLGLLTFQQAGVYYNLETLWRDTLTKNPEAWMAHTNLGKLLAKDKRTRKAVYHLEEAIKINPNALVAYYNLGYIFAREGKIDKSIENYKNTLKVNPGYLKASYNLANLLADTGKFDEAVFYYEDIIKRNPGYIKARLNFANVLSYQGRHDEAVKQYEEILLINPDLVDTYINLAVTYTDKKMFAKALSQYKKALKITLDNDIIYSNMANIYTKQGNIQRALALYKKAVAINPDNAITYYNIGIILARKGDTSEAVKYFEEAVRINPKFKAAENILRELRA